MILVDGPKTTLKKMVFKTPESYRECVGVYEKEHQAEEHSGAERGLLANTDPISV